jgi:hypothetical protein
MDASVSVESCLSGMKITHIIVCPRDTMSVVPLFNVAVSNQRLIAMAQKLAVKHWR